MCFTTKNPEVLVASQDIPVYKIIQENNAPEFLVDRIRNDLLYNIQGDRIGDSSLVTKYEPGKLYEDSGATLQAVPCMALLYTPNRTTTFSIERGFHSYADSDRPRATWRYDSLKQVIFVIPAGARYVKGHTFDGREVYISDKIRAGSLIPV